MPTTIRTRIALHLLPTPNRFRSDGVSLAVNKKNLPTVAVHYTTTHQDTSRLSPHKAHFHYRLCNRVYDVYMTYEADYVPATA